MKGGETNKSSNPAMISLDRWESISLLFQDVDNYSYKLTDFLICW